MTNNSNLNPSLHSHPDYPHAFIGKNVTIGANTQLRAGVIIEDNVCIGDNCFLDYHVIIKKNTTIGDNNIIYPYSIIGDDPQDIKFDRTKPTKVIIGNHNIIREKTTIHRGVQNTTIIGDHNFLMESVHIAHDCELKNHNIIANATLLGGHVHIGNHVFISGLCAIHQFVRIGSYVMIGGVTRVTYDAPPYSMVVGHDGHHAGINYTGLKRHAISLADRTMINNYYVDFYTFDLPIPKRLEVLKGKYQSKYIDYIDQFISDLGKKGIIPSKKFNKKEERS